ncbi:response regulator [Paenibacillus sp. TH7-28]
MFKVLLVDDEIFVRKGLQKLIPWEDLNYTLVGEADNGDKALYMIEHLQPDLVITDIRMPILDGLDLIRSVKEDADSDLFFIVISGYHDFSYAQQALRYGVHDYILKPVDDEEMTATLRKLALNMSKRKIAKTRGEDYANGSFLEALVQEKLRLEDAETYAAALGLTGASGFCYALVELHAAPGEMQVGLKQFMKALYSLEEQKSDIPVFEQERGRFGMLFTVERLKDRYGGLTQAMEKIRSGLSGQLGADVSLYAGETVHNITDVRRSYLEANEAARHKYAEGSGVIEYAQIKDKPLYVFDMSPVTVSNLIMQVEEGNQEAYRQTVDGMFEIFRTQRFAPQAVNGSLSRCMTGIISVVKEMDGSIEVEGVQRLKGLAERDYGNWSLTQLKEHFLLAIMEAEQYIAKLRKEQSKGGIKQIKKYIDSHYCENISLKSIAAQFYMNPVYLGRLFRKSYGRYFNEYLLQLRVREAKKLLRQTDLRMYEIAARVGFQNADYFVIQFEKLEKVSPTEYRNMLIDRE